MTQLPRLDGPRMSDTPQTSGDLRRPSRIGRVILNAEHGVASTINHACRHARQVDQGSILPIGFQTRSFGVLSQFKADTAAMAAR